MRLALFALFALFALLSPLASCVGTTGGDVVDFPVAAAGPAAAVAGRPYVFPTDRGWNVTLTKATLRIGAIYLSENAPISGAQTTSCILPGTYVAQVTTGMDIDLLSGAPQRFPVLGHGTTLPSVTGQVWLTGGPIDTASDSTPILTIAGTAARDAVERPFTGTLTISSNRVTGGGENAGSNTICKQRIVTPIATPGLSVLRAGGLVLRIDPRYLFTNVDFGALDDAGFSDDPSSAAYSQPSANLYQNLRSAGALYTFGWDSLL